VCLLVEECLSPTPFKFPIPPKTLLCETPQQEQQPITITTTLEEEVEVVVEVAVVVAPHGQ